MEFRYAKGNNCGTLHSAGRPTLLLYLLAINYHLFWKWFHTRSQPDITTTRFFAVQFFPWCPRLNSIQQF
jgi:hypothetical protein